MSNIMFGRNQLFGRRIFAGPIRRAGGVVVEYPVIDGHYVIDFYDANGQRTASVGSDAKDSPLIEAEFKLDEHGCAEFSLSLAHDHEIEISYNQRVDIRLFGDPQPWYSGYIQVRPVAGTTENIWKYSGYGFFEQLEHVIVKRNYANRDIAAIASDIIATDIEPGTGARYNESNIYATGYTASAISFDYATAKECLKQLSEFAVNYRYGVDQYRDVFFRPLVTEINENSRLWVGHHVEEFIPEEDVSTVVNVVYVQGGTLNSSGSNIMYQTSDAESIEKYGKREAVLSIPSAYSASDATRWGDNELQALKDPQRTAKLDGIHNEIAKRNIRPEGMARITTYDGKVSYDYPIQTVRYSLSSEGIVMTMELGEYVEGLEQIIVKMARDAKSAELLQRGNNAQLV